MKRKSESGQALVFTALALVVLIGFAGLAIDMGASALPEAPAAKRCGCRRDCGCVEPCINFRGCIGGGRSGCGYERIFGRGRPGLAVRPPAPATAVGSVAVPVNNPPCSGPHQWKRQLCRGVRLRGTADLLHEDFRSQQ